jgi:hypothetical protein
MPAPTVKEIMEKIDLHLKSYNEFLSQSDIMEKLFYDEKFGAYTAHERDVFKALNALVCKGDLEKTRKKEPDGERWVYSSKDKHDATR